MRQRLMAEFSSVVHEGNSPVMPLRITQHRRRVAHQTRGRLLVAAAAALCLLMSLSGMSVLLSRDALPGDALYSFKRTTESAELGLTFGEQPRALKHLEFASDRVNEIEVMANQAEAATKRATKQSAAGQSGFLRALDDFDSDAAAGARLLTRLALSGKPSSLGELRSWAEQQKARLVTLRAALPALISARVDSTLGLLDRIIARANALSGRSSCVTITSGTRDDLGLLPAKGACQPSPVSGKSPVVPVPDVTSAPSVIPPNVVIPNPLLHPPSVNPVPAPSQNGSGTRSDLSPTRSPGGVLANPSQPGATPLRPQTWGHPLPGHKPTVPLPSILKPGLLPHG
ncbi:MAG: hypothetical protein JO272_04200 [Pseudonocardiales bacterium]|nr:hypothetical protein [Pseudonocardiales bacterium]